MAKRELQDVNVEVKGESELTETQALALQVASINKSKKEKIQISIYLDDDVWEKYQHYGKVAGKGARSALVNELLRRALNEY